jgi:hypothetical protein
MHLANEPFGVFGQLETGRCRCHTTSVSGDKFYTQFILEAPQIETKRWLRDVEVARCLCNTPVFNDSQKQAQAFDIQMTVLGRLMIKN